MVGTKEGLVLGDPTGSVSEASSSMFVRGFQAGGWEDGEVEGADEVCQVLQIRDIFRKGAKH